jgi:hypothetical protein
VLGGAEFAKRSTELLAQLPVLLAQAADLRVDGLKPAS